MVIKDLCLPIRLKCDSHCGCEQLRKNDRDIKKSTREVERNRTDLEKLEKNIENDIKQAAKKGNKEVLKVLAKQLVKVRKQKANTYTAASRFQAVSVQGKLIHSQNEMTNAISTSAKTLSEFNKVMDPMKTIEIMKEFEKQNAKMNLTEEMISDSLDDIMNDSNDEEEENTVVNQILDEIGIEISAKLIDAPKAPNNLHTGPKQRNLSTDSLDKQLANLKAS
ncbi:hypothetical protein HELRODRAFT_167737 [Helobdella robusta]|uniref:Uncharacterized protein n=1 Tax=Helobdella robusta TaxID=6412 RepID=T1EZQ6_HELRO|nr:hypothetical protein HELRODRAFT_167737 [Helobdella robusta]ESO09913.1 hypothetical protein HELRODRAFT_167737 [Helobdella robusta]